MIYHLDAFWLILIKELTEAEVEEVERYLTGWNASTYTSVAHSIVDHAERKGLEPLKYLRKAHNFNKKGAIRVPKTGYRRDSTAVYRKGGEYLIVRQDAFGSEKIVTYGVNHE